MTKDKTEPRHVAVSLVCSPLTGRLLMVTSRAHPDLWIFPKGGLEEGESSGQAAVRESWEEAGTPPSLPAPEDLQRLMMLALPSKKKMGSVWHVHVLEVNEDVVECIEQWPESHERKRAWFTPSECLLNIQEWSKIPSTSTNDNHLDDPVELVNDHAEEEDDGDESQDREQQKKGKQQQKMEKKAGAMELALRQFMESKGKVLEDQ
ncbi:hypothetical protein L486_07419 [Kwoniella mangroviensis CBS 10435]|uniref:Nudix hydrolase domain-containing protein n=1 Tax=Kwoniella mangroviensis CBS 10435 TaxID=1331196 RepID=A0A1B9IIU4_9TREE|nr:uncharacterized protein I203_04979 [Kwoniella mangroviensis CBS 8507]OCF55304.1 hypothetical protein L486_07419 [Kwoniella mangroviensis CBS 10435]OCF65957.1 hypothetical protein I203_04979 [Kwoniella mangroviensis CBS 8507]OCF71969.1 hypothetical protein I204_07232 [Kwoniella mangroviensis CBS 8886]